MHLDRSLILRAHLAQSQASRSVPSVLQLKSCKPGYSMPNPRSPEWSARAGAARVSIRGLVEWVVTFSKSRRDTEKGKEVCKNLEVGMKAGDEKPWEEAGRREQLMSGFQRRRPRMPC